VVEKGGGGRGGFEWDLKTWRERPPGHHAGLGKWAGNGSRPNQNPNPNDINSVLGVNFHAGLVFSFFMKCQSGDIRCYSHAPNFNIHPHVR